MFPTYRRTVICYLGHQMDRKQTFLMVALKFKHIFNKVHVLPRSQWLHIFHVTNYLLTGNGCGFSLWTCAVWSRNHVQDLSTHGRRHSSRTFDLKFLSLINKGETIGAVGR